MKVITAPYHYELKEDEVGVFLAGGITKCDNWQDKVIKELLNRIEKSNEEIKATEEEYSYCDFSGIKEFLYNLVIFNPRRENFPIHDSNASYEQIKWEFEYLEKADIFSMFFASGESDQPICMYELGRYVCRMQAKYPADWRERIFIFADRGYKRFQDVLIQMDLATNRSIHVTDIGDPIVSHASGILLCYNYVNSIKNCIQYKKEA